MCISILENTTDMLVAVIALLTREKGDQQTV